MLVQGGFKFLGLRLFDENGDAFVNKVWCTADLSDSAWVTKNIDRGQEIIGLQAYTDYNNFCRIAWLLWEPTVKDVCAVPAKRQV